jgi:putative cell wall-binding protein
MHYRVRWVVAGTLAAAGLAATLALPVTASAADAPRATVPPRIDWVLGNSAARTRLAAELRLTGPQQATSARLGVRLVDSLDSAWAASENASASPTRAAALARTYNSAVDSLQATTLADLAGQLGIPQAEVASAVQSVWDQEVQVFHEANAYNHVNASLGVQSYKVVATSFGDGITGPGVAVPDMFVKFAALGNRSTLTKYGMGAAYPAGLRYGCGISLNGHTVAWAPVKDVGPWNLEDNYWNSRYDPTRPRHEFTDLPQGTPEAAAAYFDGYHGGKDDGLASNGVPRKVLNPAGLDVLPPTVTQLGQDPSKGMREWVTAWFLWEPGGSLPPVAEGRIAGADRYATSLMLSQQGWPNGASAVTLATGRGFADALCASPLAGTYGGPIILVDPYQGITRFTRRELTRLAPKKIFIVGSTGALPSSLDSQCAQVLPTATVKRLAGVSRYETAAEVARAIETSVGTVSKVIVATGRDYPDALAAGPLAAKSHWPILLSDAWNVLPSATSSALADLKPTSSLVVGGTGAVSDRVFGRLPSATRLAGANRYATAAAIDTYADAHGLDPSYLGVTTGVGYADALSAGPFAASRGGMLVLVTRYSVPDPTAAWVHAVHGSVAAADAIGGTAVVDDGVMSWMHVLFRPAVP